VVPDIFEIEDEPLCRSTLFLYHMSTVGTYTEYVHQIEVTWKGKKYDYVVGLVLDNESALFSGREKYGFPKVFGQVDLNIKTASGYLTGSVERPKGQHVVPLGFSLIAKYLGVINTDNAKEMLTLWVIPLPVEGAPPDIIYLPPHGR